MTAAIKPPDRDGTDMQQDEVIGFLRQPGAYPQPCHDVRVIETHAALVFLAGSNAYKIKKAVTYPYLDFSTLAKRQAACRRELEINQPHAPQIYLGIVPVCRMPDGELAIGGTGKPVEWTVHMHRFDDHALLATAIDADPPRLPFYDRLADEIASYHAKASVIADRNGAAAMQVIVDELREAFASAGDVIGRTRQAEFDRLLSGQLDTCRHRLDQRARRGYLRRCHGDLHLGNIVVLSGRPVLFDAIEFNEEFASIDTLYDLAFLIMDLGKRGMRPEANRLLNRYLSQTGDPANIAALQAVPLFLACRAGIRAMVAITRMHQASSKAVGITAKSEALDYFRAATGFLKIEQPGLVCIGGLSGTGKTTMARRLAPVIGRAPGALHLRSDVERKKLFGVEETGRLEAGAYTPHVSTIIYARLMHKAKLALLAGSSVIVDAVFLNDRERHHAERTAQSAGAMFSGLWLEADETAMISRVTARTGDASDATASVVRKQIKEPVGTISWHKIAAGGSIGHTADLCRKALSKRGLAQGSAKPLRI